jgi:hypothetical protein
MGNYPKFFTAVWLFAVALCLQSCNEQGVQLEKKKVQFTLNPTTTSNGRAGDIDLPENARARISVASSNGASVLSDHEISVLKVDNSYITDPVELLAGAYTVTDFMIVKDSAALYATPKNGTELSTLVTHALPYKFSINENSAANVSMHVVDVRNEDPEKFGYASSKIKANALSIAVYEIKAGQTVLTSATAELRQHKKIIKTFSLNAAVNTITIGGDHKAPYTLTVYTGESAKTQTFYLKKLKQEIGKKPLSITLEPALVLTIESSVDEGNEYEEYFEFAMEGTGAVNINWGDGEVSAEMLPFTTSHEYTYGSYTAIITGNLSKITNLYGFSYGSIISAITGLTNLTSLKTYSPSWGAVPIKVDLSNCKKLETINIAKYGAPYESIDLRTDFKLPKQHYIKEFIFDAPSFDINREYISAEELEAMVANIYNNVIKRNIYNGKFFVNPVATIAPKTQQKLDVLENKYNWDIRFNDEIYNEYDSEAGRMRTDLEARRENWLRDKFPNSQRRSQNAKLASWE